jgi:hypothetical protein
MIQFINTLGKINYGGIFKVPQNEPAIGGPNKVIIQIQKAQN